MKFFEGLHYWTTLAAATCDNGSQKLNIACLPTTEAGPGAIQSALRVIFTVVGALAVMMVVIGAIKYSSSEGDPQAISKAKNTILYALVGVVICIFAVSIVSFVGNRAL